MITTEEMIQRNREQAKFYDGVQAAEMGRGRCGYSKNQSANIWTRTWAWLRYRQQMALKQTGVEKAMYDLYTRHMNSKGGGSFLEVGCYSGSPFTIPMADAAGSYLGVEISPLAAKALSDKFAARGMSYKADVQIVDILTMNEERKYDLIYAHGVLHHFENPEPLFAKLAALSKSAAVLLFTEPCAVNPIYRIIRAVYRPFQSDASWEWPFQKKTVEALEKYFTVIEGFGWGSRSLLFSLLAGLPLLCNLMMNTYIRVVASEIDKGWHSEVWNNSMVTACYRIQERGYKANVASYADKTTDSGSDRRRFECT